MNPSAGRWRIVRPILLGLAGLAALYVIAGVYAVGQTLLAGTLLVIASLALWTYGWSRMTALRYLFPGVAAAIVFVVFPMLYTVGVGFTNYSSRNLLDFDRARAYLLDETVAGEGGGLAFALIAEGSEFRIRLSDPDRADATFVTSPLPLQTAAAIVADAMASSSATEALPLKAVIEHQAALKALAIRTPDGRKLRMTSLRAFGPVRPAWTAGADGSLVGTADGQVLRPNFATGYFETAAGERHEPGFKVNVGFAHYRRIFTDERLREPLARVFVWTLVFSALTVVFTAALGLLLAVLLNWQALGGRAAYRLLLFLPYAVPGFISILIFKGLFNQNLGEINLILDALFGIKPAWFADPFLARTMILIVNTWLGFPYMMVVCTGLIQSIPGDLYEASAVAGAGPIKNFVSITAPLIVEPLIPLLISSFAFNFNNYVLIALLTGGRPDFLDTRVPAGTTDILVSYASRMAFQDSGQQFGLAAAISTVIFFIVAAITLVQMRFVRLAGEARR